MLVVDTLKVVAVKGIIICINYYSWLRQEDIYTVMDFFKESDTERKSNKSFVCYINRYGYIAIFFRYQWFYLPNQ